MSEQFRALIFILAMMLPMLAMVRIVLGDRVIPMVDLDRRLKAWVGILLSAFLARNFWLYLIVSGALMAWVISKDKNPMAVFLSLFFVVPPTTTFIPGFGPISYIIEINHLRLASLIILGWAYLRMRRDKSIEPFGAYVLDWLAFAYLALQVILFLRSDPTVTTILRTSVELFIDGFLPYFVASRAARNIPALRDMLASFLFAIVMLAPITIFEFGKNWLLYTSINEALGLGWDVMPYIMRNGNVRPYATAGNSLILGFILAVGVGLYPAVKSMMTPRNWYLSYALLIGGLCASLARGAYVGATVAILVAAGTGRGAGTRLSKLSLGAAFAVVAIALSPFADQVASYLPFIGNVDTDNVTYRTRLFEVSMQVIAMNPLFGSSNFMLDPLMEQMRQGQGIIDIVNSYLGIALGTGYVGLAVYVSIYLVAMAKTWMGIRRSALISPELEGIGRALLGTTVGIMIIIATASCFLSMPFIIWIIMGLSLRYSQLTTNLGAVRYGQSASAHQPERPRQRTPGAA